MIMKVYGYKRNDADFVELQEASLECSIEELDKIIDFLQYSRNQHDRVKNDTEICHSHYRDWDKEWRESDTDLILISIFKDLK